MRPLSMDTLHIINICTVLLARLLLLCVTLGLPVRTLGGGVIWFIFIWVLSLDFFYSVYYCFHFFCKLSLSVPIVVL